MVLVVENVCFLGYPFSKKGWKFFDLETKEFFVSRDVHFHEDKFPFAHVSADTSTLPTTGNVYDLDVGFGLVDKGSTSTTQFLPTVELTTASQQQ